MSIAYTEKASEPCRVRIQHQLECGPYPPRIAMLIEDLAATIAENETSFPVGRCASNCDEYRHRRANRI